jgi:SPP1 family predicted phage head-tail adaptor
MRSGDLRQLITLQSKIVTRDAMGGEVISWVDRGMVPASVEPLRGREYFAAKEQQAETDVRFRIRYWSEVTSAWRVNWEGRYYDILSVIDVNGRHVEQQLMCKSQQ